MQNIQTSISTETALNLTADSRRRKVLRHLMENSDEPITIDELVAAIEDDATPQTGATKDIEERLLIELRHKHLPKLADAGLIDYDERTGTLRYHPQENIEALVRFVEDTSLGTQ